MLKSRGSLNRYLRTQDCVSQPISRARKRQQNFDNSQDQHILNLPQNSVHFSFWNEARTLEKTNEDAFEALSILKSHQQGPCTKKIFAALTLISSKNYQELYQVEKKSPFFFLKTRLKLLRGGLNPNSRDLLGYSLLHASVLANSGRTIQTLLTAGAISQEAFCIKCTVTFDSPVLSTSNRQQARIKRDKRAVSILRRCTWPFFCIINRDSRTW